MVSRRANRLVEMARPALKVTCPNCSHEFDFRGTPGKCFWCDGPFVKDGNKRYCSKKCRTAGRNHRQYQRLKDDPKRRAYKLEYMKNYMRKRKAKELSNAG